MEKIFFFKSNGAKLAGVLHMPEKKVKVPIVVFNHGFTGNKSEVHCFYTKLGRALAKCGIAAFRFDCFGCGDSEGVFKNTDFYRDISDGHNAIELTKRFKDVNKSRIGVFGASKGGWLTSFLCGQRDDVKAAVIVCSPARYTRIWGKRIRKFGGRNGFDFDGNYVSKKFLDSAYEIADSNLKYVAEYPGPLLIIHGSKDKIVNPDDAKTYYKTSNSKVKKLVYIKGANHGFSSLKWERLLIKETVDWFRRHL